MAKHRTRSYEMDMTSGPILKNLLVFTMPLVLSSVLQLLFSAVNIVVVGQFSGVNSLAAVGSTSSLISLITNLFIGLSVGANVVAAKCFGAHKYQEMRKTVHTSMLLSLISGAILTLVGVAGARLFLVWMNTPGEALDLAALYLRVYFLGITSSMVYNFGSAILRAVGDTRRPLYYLLIAGVVNVVLNLLFVIQFQMDVAGVALATVISQTIPAVLIVICLMRSDGALKLELKQMRIDPGIFKEILKIGLPAGVQGILFSISNVMIQRSINFYGEEIVAGNSAAANIESFVYVAMNAFYQSAISFSSQNASVGQYKRIWKILFYAQACVFIAGIVLGNIACLFDKTLLGIYTKSAEAIAAGQVRLGIVARTYVLNGMMDVMVGMLRGIGYSVLPMIVSVVGICGLRIVWLATAAPAFGGISGIYASYPVSWSITLVAHVLSFLWAMRRISRTSDMVNL